MVETFLKNKGFHGFRDESMTILTIFGIVFLEPKIDPFKLYFLQVQFTVDDTDFIRRAGIRVTRDVH